MKYRSELDGLRAISVLSVIIYHASSDWLPGGYLGVDVFFVISGYLITGILASELTSGTFSLSNFYERRVKRIAPALFCTLILTILLSAFVLLPHQIMDLGQSIVATSVFASNFFFYFETDYFNQFTNSNPLLHTWSLAVEEQFYLFFPILLLLIGRGGKLLIGSVVFVLLICSFVLASMTTQADPQLSFYATHTRAWELMAGSLLAIFADRENRVASKTLLYDFLCFSALAGLLYSMFQFSSDSRHPGLDTVFPVLSAVALIAFLDKSHVAKLFLGSKPLVFVGLLSYSLYMYHQPILALGELYVTQTLRAEVSLAWMAMLLSATGIVSLFSYYFIERPFRRSNRFSRRSIFLGAALLTGLFVGLGLLANSTKGFQSYFAETYEVEGGVRLVDVDSERSLIDQIRTEAQKIQSIPFSDSAAKKILVFGDSFAEDAFYSLFSLNSKDLSVRFVHVEERCISKFAFSLAAKEKGRLPCARRATGSQAYPLFSNASHLLVSAQWKGDAVEELGAFLDTISSVSTADTFVVGSIQFNDITSLSLYSAKQKISVEDSQGFIYENLRLDRLASSDRARDFVLARGLERWIDKRAFFCDWEDKRCRVFDSSGAPYIWDHGHLTARAYAPFGEYLLGYLSD